MPAKPRRSLNFTKSAIEALPLPCGGREYHHDTKIHGLTVCVTPAGSKTFYLVRRIGLAVERERLGGFPELSVEQARTAAQSKNGRIADGENPAERRRRRAGAPTLGEAFKQFLEAPSRTKAKRARSAITIKGYQYLYDEHLADWAERQVSKITRADVEKLHLRIGAERPYLANRVLSLLKAVFGYAQEHGLHDTNPAARLRPFEEHQRERFLQAHELPKFFAALDAEPNEKIRDFVKVALFTGQRRTNVLTMRWADVDLIQGVWTIPKTKSGKPLTIPLAAPAHEVLVRRAATKGDCEFVFPGRHGVSHLQDPMREWRGILERAGIGHLRIHDLRRTFGSWQAATGASLPTIGKSLGHARPETTAIYARLELSPIRQAVDAATAAIIAAATPKADEGEPQQS